MLRLLDRKPVVAAYALVDGATHLISLVRGAAEARQPSHRASEPLCGG